MNKQLERRFKIPHDHGYDVSGVIYVSGECDQWLPLALVLAGPHQIIDMHNPISELRLYTHAKTSLLIRGYMTRADPVALLLRGVDQASIASAYFVELTMQTDDPVIDVTLSLSSIANIDADQIASIEANIKA